MNYDKETERILGLANEVNSKLAKLLVDYIQKFSSFGTLTATDDLAMLERDITKLLKDAGYSKTIDQFFLYYNDILDSTLEYYKKVSNIKQTLSESKGAEFVVESLRDTLKGKSFNINFTDSIAKEIRTLILSGSTYDDFKDYIKNNLGTENSKLNSYLKNITNGVFSKYDGALQNELKQTYNPKKGYYIGDEIETSRPVCVHIKDKFGSGLISTEDIKIILDEFCPNGVPSDKVISFTHPISGKVTNVKKGSGMMKNTTVSNFDINLGGIENGCRHKWRWKFD